MTTDPDLPHWNALSPELQQAIQAVCHDELTVYEAREQLGHHVPRDRDEPRR